LLLVGLHQLPAVDISSITTNLHTKFLLQAQKQWKDSAMILASNKQQNNTERETLGEKKRVNKADKEQTTGKNK
jgi:hypothetical protein